MKALDITSLIIAAVVGMVLLWAIDNVLESCPTCDATTGMPNATMLISGAVVGAGVQISLRVTGVS